MEIKWNILVIDDEAIYHKLIRVMLKGEPYNVVHFVEFNDLKNFLNEFPDNHLIIMDYHLHEHSGANYIRRLKEDGFEPYFIGISSSESDAVKNEMKLLGAKAFFQKDDNLIRDLPSVINGLVSLKGES